jgi:uncharacterized membrane protein YhaH (DUF805 family)
MDAMEWMILPLKRYAQFSGRSRRKEYWMWILFVILASIVLGMLDSVLGLGGDTTLEPGATPNGLMYGVGLMGGVLSTLFALATFVPGLAVSVRRLHDVDRSGWWLILSFLPYLIGLALFASVVATGSLGTLAIIGGILVLVGAIAGIVLLVWFCTSGTVGANRFGPDPMDTSEEDLVRTFE